MRRMNPTGTLFFIMIMLATAACTRATDCDALDPFPSMPNDTGLTFSLGAIEVVYDRYFDVPYVADSAYPEYQSMNVKVPTSIDDTPIDTTNAPILFVFSAPGYKAEAPPNYPTPTGFPPVPTAATKNSMRALAAGYVVVEVGCRGRDNLESDTYYGKAPAAIVDLKAAVRYLRCKDEEMPGNAEWIISTGFSGAGALSALLGASGNSHLYDAYLEEIGAADEDDSVYASAAFCPITDLEHADMAYEWEFKNTLFGCDLVDQDLSMQLKDAFAEYQASLNLQDENCFGKITADNYGQFLVKTYLIPSANMCLNAKTGVALYSYLADHPWIHWDYSTDSATFSFEDYAKNLQRIEDVPAFDAFSLDSRANKLFGNETTDARHFTNYSLRQTCGCPNAEIDDDLKTVVNLMNPMYFISQGNCSGCAEHWWIRHGTNDTNTALPVVINLATLLKNKGKDVNIRLYWDKKHMANDDPDDFIAWIGEITGYTIPP